jgi:hypothetical protein
VGVVEKILRQLGGDTQAMQIGSGDDDDDDDDDKGGGDDDDDDDDDNVSPRRTSTPVPSGR